MKKNFAVFFAAALLLAAGCVKEIPRVVPDPCIPAEREPEARAEAEKMALGLAEAFKTGDFEKFNAVQPKGGRAMPQAAFAKLRGSLMRRFGVMTKAEYFGRLDQGLVNDYLWKFTFEAPKRDDKDKDKDKDKPAVSGRHEIICWIRVGFSGGKPVVAGFSFDLH